MVHDAGVNARQKHPRERTADIATTRVTGTAATVQLGQRIPSAALK